MNGDLMNMSVEMFGMTFSAKVTLVAVLVALLLRANWWHHFERTPEQKAREYIDPDDTRG